MRVIHPIVTLRDHNLSSTLLLRYLSAGCRQRGWLATGVPPSMGSEARAVTNSDPSQAPVRATQRTPGTVTQNCMESLVGKTHNADSD